MTLIPVHPIGAFIGIAIALAIAATIYWMLHPPSTRAEFVAKTAERTIEEMVGSIIVVFADEVHSEHMMALAVRLAQRERAHLLAAYVVEVPLILPQGAQMPDEDRRGYQVLATAEVIAQHRGVHIGTELIHARQIASAVIDLAKREKANLIVMGSYREGKYSGAPLGRAIEDIASRAQCDVLIGVPGPHGRMLSLERTATTSTTTT